MTRRRLALLVVASLWASALAGTLGARAEPAAAGECNGRSWIGGSVDLCDGVLVYRDYVYDDYGANTGQPAENTAPLSETAGDMRYTTDVNSADLVDLSLSIEGDRLHAVFELNALFHKDSTVAALAIDSDDDKTTGGGEWKDLGVTSEGWDVLETFDKGDPNTNLIEGDVPLPPGDRWRVQALTAVNGGPVMNVAFRGTDEKTAVGTWWEDDQAAALEDGDISAFGYTVDVSDMTNGATRPAGPNPGFHERIYTSRYTIKPGEGMAYQGKFGRHGETTQVCEQEFQFFGRYQPYGIYIPGGGDPKGMQLMLHGCSANHASLIDQPGAQARLGEDLNRIIIVPLGRGPYGYYSDISERDVLDVMTDVERNYDIDKDSVFSGGYSMGGYGAYRMAMLFPDRFAGLISWVGFTGDCYNGTPRKKERACRSGAIGNVINYVKNLLNIPSAMLYAGGDELVHASSWTAMARRFAAHESPYVFYKHPVAEHLTLGLADDWRKEAAYTSELSRVVNPDRVLFRTKRFLDSPKYGIHHDHAYWVSKIRGRTGDFIDVDLTTSACGETKFDVEEGTDEGTDPVPWQSEYRKLTVAKKLPPEPRITGSVRNVQSLAIDATRSCIGGGAFSYDINSDGRSKIRFSDGVVLRLKKGDNKGVSKANPD
jgi:pimeloyl-ACP methyl ester carboxylesterase